MTESTEKETSPVTSLFYDSMSKAGRVDLEFGSGKNPTLVRVKTTSYGYIARFPIDLLWDACKMLLTDARIKAHLQKELKSGPLRAPGLMRRHQEAALASAISGTLAGLLQEER